MSRFDHILGKTIVNIQRLDSEADKLFNGLSTGGEVEIPLTESPDGSYFAMFRDKYGIEWMVNLEAK